MLILYGATIECDKELAKVYEWAYGDLLKDDNGRVILDERKLATPINPIKFPLANTTITHSGGRTIISIPHGAGSADFRIDELSKSPAPTRVMKGQKEIYQLAGISDRLLRQNVDLQEATVNFVITKWIGQLLPNQRLARTGTDE